MCGVVLILIAGLKIGGYGVLMSLIKHLEIPILEDENKVEPVHIFVHRDVVAVIAILDSLCSLLLIYIGISFWSITTYNKLFPINP